MVALSVALLLTLGLNAMPEPTHQCDSRELLAYCFSLSPTEKTCYTLPNDIGGKRCTEGWAETFKETEVISTGAAIGKQYHCSTTECVEIP